MSRSRLNVLEILKRLPRTNCRECRLPTCLAFANQVAQGLRRPADCPHLNPESLDISRLEDLATANGPFHEGEEGTLLELREAMGSVDLAGVADAVGGRMQGEELVLLCLGREFTIDSTGRLRSQCHANFWVLIPLLDYVIHAASPPPAGKSRERTREWIKYDELGQGMSRSAYFTHRGEGELRRLLDEQPDLVRDLLDLLSARPVDHGFAADLSVELRPMPHVFLLVCHWEAEGPFESKLSIYFDRNTEAHLSLEATTILVLGIVEMLKRMVARHTFKTGS